MKLTPHITSFAGHMTPAEIEYRNEAGEIMGLWSYGAWNTDYPFHDQQNSGFIIIQPEHETTELEELL